MSQDQIVLFLPKNRKNDFSQVLVYFSGYWYLEAKTQELDVLDAAGTGAPKHLRGPPRESKCV